jgi:hypothetical protein
MLRLDLEERIGKSKGEEEEEIRLTRNRRRGSHVFRTLALTVVNAAHGRYETQHCGRTPTQGAAAAQLARRPSRLCYVSGTVKYRRKLLGN